ncbi:hypothetical protein IMSAGC008_01504 [Muribaculaceae bacterium]|nr:hypothetical protein IMSAGC008_01504 [Muribaculaceae bacterium]
MSATQLLVKNVSQNLDTSVKYAEWILRRYMAKLVIILFMFTT